MKTAKLRDEKEVLDRQQHADIEAQKNLEENLQQLHNRENELESQEEQMRTRLRKILDSSARHKEDLADLKKELHTMKDKHRDVRLSILTVSFILTMKSNKIFSSSGHWLVILLLLHAFKVVIYYIHI